MKEITNADLSRILRNQAWERAKAELSSMLWTYYGGANCRPDQFSDFNAALEEFIKKVEDNALHE
jgi:CRISPR/Cas system CSM-associated protein Csm2 small subunit